MGPYAEVDYIILNPMPKSTLSPSQGLWIWPQATTQEMKKGYKVVFIIATLGSRR
jgi:hypothetical protein